MTYLLGTPAAAKHADCGCCGGGCIFSASATCTLLSGLSCSPCAPAIRFTMGQESLGRQGGYRVGNTYSPPYSFACDQLISFYVDELWLQCNGTWFVFDHMVVTYGCNASQTEVSVDGRAFTFYLDADECCVSGCSISVHAYYKEPPNSTSINCFCYQLGIGPEYPFVGLVRGPIGSPRAFSGACTPAPNTPANYGDVQNVTAGTVAIPMRESTIAPCSWSGASNIQTTDGPCFTEAISWGGSTSVDYSHSGTTLTCNSYQIYSVVSATIRYYDCIGATGVAGTLGGGVTTVPLVSVFTGIDTRAKLCRSVWQYIRGKNRTTPGSSCFLDASSQMTVV